MSMCYEAFWEPLVRSIQRTIGQVCFPNSPLIIYSEPKRNTPEWNWEGTALPPMDYLGTYFCGDSTCTGYHTEEPLDGRRIEMYPKRIEKCAQQLHSKQVIVAGKTLEINTVQESLERIVLTHELFHGFLHLGLNGVYIDHLPNRSTNSKIKMHLKKRLHLWKKLSTLVIEQHAQLGTWHFIMSNPIDVEVFSKLMENQPKKYMLDLKIKQTHPGHLWSWMCYMRHDDGKHMRTYDGMIQYLVTGELSADQYGLDAVLNL